MHLSHFLLVDELLPLLRNSGGRVISVASVAHYLVNDESIFDNLLPDNSMKKGIRGSYGRAKLANILFASHLAKVEPEIFSMSLHPGAIFTPIWQFKNITMYHKIRNFFMKLCLRDPIKGCGDILFCAAHSDPKALNGGYIMNHTLVDHRYLKSKLARSDSLAEKLWTISKEAIESKL